MVARLRGVPDDVAKLSRDLAARFDREARAVASLAHPNIIAVYDVGESDGSVWIAMELIEGRTVRDLLASGPLPIRRALDIATQVGEGLAAAHAAGIVHRDLKPENLMVSKDGYVKILDFGLAKRVETVAPGQETSAPTNVNQTEPGTVMGTAGYMSPEQVKGFPVDHRSDIFSFGTILYELLSGRRAFKRDTNAETMAAILRDEPAELLESKRNISPALDRIVQHCLEKDRERRFQSARDIAFSLSEQPLSTVPSSSDSGRVRADEGFWVAVLPFKASGATAEITALAEALTEEIVTGLSRFSYLRVVARTAPAGVSSADPERGARYVMEGSLRQVGAKLRLAVQLVDATTGAHLWAENYERSFSPEAVFELQDDLVPRIVSTVADQYGALVHSMSESLRGRSAGEYSAHEAVLRAFGYWERVTLEEHAEVRAILEAAVARAPGHSDCLAELSLIYWHEYAFGFNVGPDPLGRARAAAQRAVALAPTSHFAHCALATSLFFQKDYLAFRPAAERALALNRMDSSTAAILGNMIAYAGDWEYGLGIVERATQLNPHHAGWYHYVAFCDAYRKHDYSGALSSALKVNMPAYHWPHVYLAAVYGQLGEQQPVQRRVAAQLIPRPLEQRADLRVGGPAAAGLAPAQ